LFRWQRQLPQREARIRSDGLALTVPCNPGTTSICKIHGSSSLRIPSTQNSRTQGGHYSARKLQNIQYLWQGIQQDGTNLWHDSRICKTQRQNRSQCTTQRRSIPARLGFQRNSRFQENAGSPYRPKQNHFNSGKLGSHIGKRARQVPLWELRNLCLVFFRHARGS
jgi:hypothetical protein